MKSLTCESNAIVFEHAPDAFLKNFVPMYQNNVEFCESLIVCILKAFCAKHSGNDKPQFEVKAMNFFIAMDSLSRKSFEFLSANMLGPALRTIQRTNAITCKPPFIACSNSELRDVITRTLKEFSVKICEKLGIDVVPFSIAIDGTKVPKNASLSAAHRCIIGYCYPHHMISVEGKSEIEVAKLLQGKDPGFVHAEEVKVAVVTFQQVPQGMCPYTTLCGRPQTTNESSSFNDDVVTAALLFCEEENNACLLNVAIDGVSCDADFVRVQLCRFLEGTANHLGITDPNHNFKNFRYQIIGGSGCAVLGAGIIDPNLLRSAGVSPDLWRIKDYEVLVLKLASYDSIKKLCELLPTEDEFSVSALCVTLYFVRLSLYGTNSKHCDFKDR